MGNPYSLLLQAIEEQKAHARKLEGLCLTSGQAQLLCITEIEQRFDRLCKETRAALEADFLENGF